MSKREVVKIRNCHGKIRNYIDAENIKLKKYFHDYMNNLSMSVEFGEKSDSDDVDDKEIEQFDPDDDDESEESDSGDAVYVIIYVDIDCDCPKKTEIEIIGVYTDIKEARKKEKELDNEMESHPYDDRCRYYGLRTVTLNK